MHTCMYMWRSEVDAGCSPLRLSTVCIYSLSLNLELVILASLLSQLVPESPSLHYVLVEMTGRPPYSPGLWVGLWDQNKSPFSCRTS